MTVHTRLIAADVATAVGMTGLVLAQGAGTPPPQGQGQTPAPAAGRGDSGQRGAGQGGRQGGGGRRGGFTQFTRELAPQDVLVRGKSLYEANCASCHAAALKSQQSSDVLLPGIATCRACHHSGTEAAESRCFECHTYHDPAQRKPAHSNFSVAELRGRAE